MIEAILNEIKQMWYYDNNCGFYRGPRVRNVLWLQENLDPGTGLVVVTRVGVPSPDLLAPSVPSSSLIHLSGSKAATAGSRAACPPAQGTQTLASLSLPPLLPGPARIRLSSLDLETLTRGRGNSWKSSHFPASRKMDWSDQIPKWKKPHILQEERKKRGDRQNAGMIGVLETTGMRAAGASWVWVGRSGWRVPCAGVFLCHPGLCVVAGVWAVGGMGRASHLQTRDKSVCHPAPPRDSGRKHRAGICFCWIHSLARGRSSRHHTWSINHQCSLYWTKHCGGFRLLEKINFILSHIFVVMYFLTPWWLKILYQLSFHSILTEVLRHYFGADTR